MARVDELSDFEGEQKIAINCIKARRRKRVNIWHFSLSSFLHVNAGFCWSQDRMRIGEEASPWAETKVSGLKPADPQHWIQHRHPTFEWYRQNHHLTEWLHEARLVLSPHSPWGAEFAWEVKVFIFNIPLPIINALWCCSRFQSGCCSSAWIHGIIALLISPLLPGY